jgi:hypothetical protein
MDSGPNHLVDISLRQEYAGICGFTLEEFDPLFADRLKTSLASLKKNGQMESTATRKDLRAEIFRWYDGYNWGGETRVLNPFSILNFFNLNSFDNYWIQSGRPGHLTALIKARPLDFLEPQLKSYLFQDIRKSALNNLKAGPVLFHSGYLTLDERAKDSPKASAAEKKADYIRYYFRLPNFEVSSSYHADCFSEIFGLEDLNELKTVGKDFQKALLTRDHLGVSKILSNFFSQITYYQKPKDEKTFHILVQALLMAMSFEVQSELAGSVGRLDLRLELPGAVYCVIELKYCPAAGELDPTKENAVLANLALERLPAEETNESLAVAARNQLNDNIEIRQIIIQKNLNKITIDEMNNLLVEIASKSLPIDDQNAALAAQARKKLTSEEIAAALLKATPKSTLTPEQIDVILTKAVKEALTAIIEKDYHGLVNYKANEFIDLGLSVYGFGSEVKAAFEA